MRARHSGALDVLRIVVVVSLLPVPVSGQVQSSDVSVGSRTPWGDPDVQGVWEYWTFTPLERPENLSGTDELTREEAAAVAEQAREAALAIDRDGPRAGSTGAYGQAVWTERDRATALTQPSLIVDPPNGELPALTSIETNRVSTHREAGGRPVRSRAAGIGSDSHQDRGLAERCLVGFSTGPPMLPAGYNNNVQIFQAPGYVVLAVEMIHDVRVIPLDGRPHLPPDRRAGHPAGRSAASSARPRAVARRLARPLGG